MKKQVFKLEIDDFDEGGVPQAYLFFHTATPGYLFADDLNHLYGLSLGRLDDLCLQGQLWPLYTYRDILRQMDYYLIERPLGLSSYATHWTPGHKMMILQGESAFATAKQICDDFNTAPSLPDACNPVETERYEILTSYQQTLTPVTQYDINAQENTSKKVLKERSEMETLFTAILDILDLSVME